MGAVYTLTLRQLSGKWRLIIMTVLAAMPVVVALLTLAERGAPTVAEFEIIVSALVGVAMYASAFVWLGLVSTQAIGVGLLYIVLWEGFFSGFVSGVRLLSIRHSAIAVMHAIDGRRFADAEHLGPAVAMTISTLVIGGFLFATVRRLRKMDVP